MNNVIYDSPRLQEMENFLKYIYTIFYQNPLEEMNKDIVYNELCRFGLKNTDIGQNREFIDIESFFYKWLDRNQYQTSNKVFRSVENNNFLQYLNYCGESFDKNSRYIKLYVPLDYNGIYEGVNELFDFIGNLKIRHTSKVSRVIRSDNVTIRLDEKDEENAKKIINFILSNPKLKNALNKTNPFVPSIYGIGYMKESGISYNSEMAKLICEYAKLCVITKTEPNLQHFYNWFLMNNKSNEVSIVFKNALGINEEKKDNINLFLQTLKDTYSKYGIRQIILAINMLLKDNDYSYFSDYGNLKDEVSKDQIKQYIENVLKTDDPIIKLSDEDKVSAFCYKVFSDNLVFKFDEACMVTLVNHGPEQLENAINHMLSTGSCEKFSRYSENNRNINYRILLSKYSKESALYSLRESLILRNIDIRSFDIKNLVQEYVKQLSNFTYKTDSSKSMNY